MQIIDRCLELNIDPTAAILDSYFLSKDETFSLSDCLFLDIETTGLTAADGEVYLIGCLYYHASEEKMHLRQFYTSDFSEELSMLRSFLRFAAPFKTLISLYGNRFDFACLRDCLKQYHLCEEPFSAQQCLDISAELKPLRDFFHIPDLKRRSLEQFMGLHRTDEYTGEQLKRIRDRLLSEHDPDNTSILTHNADDLTTLFSITRMLAYRCAEQLLPTSVFFSFETTDSIQSFISSGSWEPDFVSYIEHAKKSAVLSDGEQSFDLYGILRAQFPFSVPVPVHFLSDGFLMHFIEDRLIVIGTVFFGTRRLFFSDYRNYMYLPGEDRAIHRSLCTTMQPGVCVKATYETSYEPQEDYYLTTPNRSRKSLLDPFEYGPVLSRQYTDFIGCMRVRDIEDHTDEYASYALKAALWCFFHREKP